RHDASFSWKDLAWLRSITSLPLVLKGIVRGDDAARAADVGVAGIVVSNHGARQLDGAPVTLDGGVRWGTDVLKALALGARAVLVGRPVLWGLAVGGARGVVGVLDVLRGELDRAMALSGCADAAAIPRDLVRLRSR